MINMTNQIDKFERSWERLCQDFARGEFFPEYERDIYGYLYYALVAHEGIPKDFVHIDYKVKVGQKNRQVDVFIGKLRRKPIQVTEELGSRLLVEIKLYKSNLDSYLFYCQNYGVWSLVRKDVDKLNQIGQQWADNLVQVAAAIFFRKLPPYTHVKETSKTLQVRKKLYSELEELEGELKEKGIRLFYGPHRIRAHSPIQHDETLV